MQENKNNKGRPSDYHEKVRSRFDEITYWLRMGLSNLEIANNLDIDESTFYDYKNKFPEFSKLLKKGKSSATAQVVNALFKKAIGYDVVETTTERVFVKEKIDVNKPPVKIYTEKMIVTKTVTKHFQPDTKAINTWLYNRNPEDWKPEMLISKADDISEDEDEQITIIELPDDKRNQSK